MIEIEDVFQADAKEERGIGDVDDSEAALGGRGKENGGSDESPKDAKTNQERQLREGLAIATCSSPSIDNDRAFRFDYVPNGEFSAAGGTVMSQYADIVPAGPRTWDVISNILHITTRCVPFSFLHLVASRPLEARAAAKRKPSVPSGKSGEYCAGSFLASPLIVKLANALFNTDLQRLAALSSTTSVGTPQPVNLRMLLKGEKSLSSTEYETAEYTWSSLHLKSENYTEPRLRGSVRTLIGDRCGKNGGLFLFGDGLPLTVCKPMHDIPCQSLNRKGLESNKFSKRCLCLNEDQILDLKPTVANLQHRHPTQSVHSLKDCLAYVGARNRYPNTQVYHPCVFHFRCDPESAPETNSFPPPATFFNGHPTLKAPAEVI
ncbi:predicted protein [Uncinocarpus reesii 1704]|uniref:Uncharacterized protein n=1 Tax=Uncinocarpus reesii (strain UAMH 1704) TaxID=336963 RepID=C4JFC0_UNCRE|nr:uncharacterized protein UREG_02342 [Uncinocarpus reesii 1704]EEP77493.1 predicted protein [Uncinocarpus reesii 1704]